MEREKALKFRCLQEEQGKKKELVAKLSWREKKKKSEGGYC